VPAERVAFDHALQSAVTARRAHYGSDRWTWRR
jgi:hypothetical protein